MKCCLCGREGAWDGYCQKCHDDLARIEGKLREEKVKKQ